MNEPAPKSDLTLLTLIIGVVVSTALVVASVVLAHLWWRLVVLAWDAT